MCGLYTETSAAFHTNGPAEPWNSRWARSSAPLARPALGARPFFAVNGHLRQVNDFGGNVTAQTGWQWRGNTGTCSASACQYFNGMSEQGQFYNRFGGTYRRRALVRFLAENVFLRFDDGKTSERFIGLY